ncbi:MAG: outer membrane protein assembly factor BamA, partial [Haliscomenobacter sp.]
MRKIQKRRTCLSVRGAMFALSILFSGMLHAQQVDSMEIMDYSNPKEYEIGGVRVVGNLYSDANAVSSISGLKVGSTIQIPGPEIPRALRALWKLRLYTDVRIVKEKTIGDVIFLEIRVQERPRLSNHTYEGVSKGHQDDLNEEISIFISKGGIVTDNLKVGSCNAIERYFAGKGYLDAKATVREEPDTSRMNSVRLVFEVDRGERVKISDIDIVGNVQVKDDKLVRKMKKTKEKTRIFASSKLIQSDYEKDKQELIKYYNTIGYRDARILGDSIWRDEKGFLRLALKVNEGNPYYFRNLIWKGNSIYDTSTLNQVLGIKTGDIYNQELLDTRLKFSQEGRDVSTLYMDNGYLFFQVTPVEVAIEGDSIDLELRIFEGPQASIDKVVVTGNDRTHEHVIRRELRTLPAEKFSRSDIIRSQREIVNLGYFNQENLGINTPVNPERGTVDIEYDVEEKPSDQLELSAGWGGFRRVIGTLGVSFNNFSTRNIFNKSAWRPLPMGDGQRVSIRGQTNGDFFQSYNVSFTEPWLGGRKPNSFSVAGFYNRFAYGYFLSPNDEKQSFNILQGSVSLGTRLKWPDDNFVSSTAINLQTLRLDNWTQGLFTASDGTVVSQGDYFNYSIRQTISRSTVSDPIFPKSGSNISLAVQLTPPYSLFNPGKDYSDLSVQQRFRFLEYHKWQIDADWFATMTGKFVLKAAAKIGMLGYYNKSIGTAPFERFQLGGDGINNRQFGFAGVDIISMRGYEINQIEANLSASGSTVATPIFSKYTVELRYPLSLNPSSSIYLLTFLQGGNAWRSFRDFNPFDLKRSAGFGMRVFLPMFGVLGFDYGIGFDKPGERSIRNLGDFNIVLGFEPE